MHVQTASRVLESVCGIPVAAFAQVAADVENELGCG
jgi:hypothetical protein